MIDRFEEEPDTYMLFVSGNEPVASVLQSVGYGTAMMVDLLEIVVCVNTELREGEYPTLMTAEERRRMMHQTIAEVVDPEKNPPKYDELGELISSIGRRSKSSSTRKSRARKGRK